MKKQRKILAALAAAGVCSLVLMACPGPVSGGGSGTIETTKYSGVFKMGSTTYNTLTMKSDGTYTLSDGSSTKSGTFTQSARSVSIADATAYTFTGGESFTAKISKDESNIITTKGEDTGVGAISGGSGIKHTELFESSGEDEFAGKTLSDDADSEGVLLSFKGDGKGTATVSGSSLSADFNYAWNKTDSLVAWSYDVPLNPETGKPYASFDEMTKGLTPYEAQNMIKAFLQLDVQTYTINNDKVKLNSYWTGDFNTTTAPTLYTTTYSENHLIRFDSYRFQLYAWGDGDGKNVVYAGVPLYEKNDNGGKFSVALFKGEISLSEEEADDENCFEMYGAEGNDKKYIAATFTGETIGILEGEATISTVAGLCTQLKGSVTFTSIPGEVKTAIGIEENKAYDVESPTYSADEYTIEE